MSALISPEDPGREIARLTAEVGVLKAKLRELYEWGLDACLQGTGHEFDGPEWHNYCISTWEHADDLLPEVRELLNGGRPESNGNFP